MRGLGYFQDRVQPRRGTGDVVQYVGPVGVVLTAMLALYLVAWVGGAKVEPHSYRRRA